MKCLRNKITDEIRRVSNERAESMIANNDSWSYCPKSYWKTLVRDVVTAKEVKCPLVEATETSEVKKKKLKVSGRQRQKILREN